MRIVPPTGREMCHERGGRSDRRGNVDRRSRRSKLSQLQIHLKMLDMRLPVVACEDTHVLHVRESRDSERCRQGC